MTNFSKLKQNNPIAFRLFETWVEKNHETSLNIWNGNIRDEDVVCWLDEKGVFVYTVLTLGDNVRFYWAVKTINPPNITELNREDGIESRKSATTQAIKKAFALLEDKLKKN